MFADPHQIQQVLLNLVINAEQAMLTANGRGTLVVRTWQDPEHESIVLEVNDDGPGVPEDVQTKIFDPFFTTKEVGKGTGLGLTVAYAIVEEHGGRMWLTSEPGAGASFYVELPVAGGKLKAVAPGELAGGGEAASGRRHRRGRGELVSSGGTGRSDGGAASRSRPAWRAAGAAGSAGVGAGAEASPTAVRARRRARRWSGPASAQARRASTARPSSSSKTRPRSRRADGRVVRRRRVPGAIARATARRRWRASRAATTT